VGGFEPIKRGVDIIGRIASLEEQMVKWITPRSACLVMGRHFEMEPQHRKRLRRLRDVLASMKKLLQKGRT